MEGQEIILSNGNRIVAYTLRDFVGMAFRRRRALLLCFFGILAGALLSAFLWPRYQAETEILVGRERVDPVVTPGQNSQIVISN